MPDVRPTFASVPCLRLAPTPSGYLHLGNGVNFVLTAACAAAIDADLFLRIDDVDRLRTRDAYLTDIGETLHWLLPRQANSLLDGMVCQSSRVSRYAEVLAGLRQNDLVFACACTRKQLAATRAAAPTNVNDYSGTCEALARDLDTVGTVWRMRESGIVVRQKEGQASYQLASLTDDVDLGVTHLVRGEDLRASTQMQRVLAKAISTHSEPAFAAFLDVGAWHHPLVCGGDSRKLSKSAGADSLAALRHAGVHASEVLAQAAMLIGGAPVTQFDELAALVIERLPTSW